MPLLPRRKSSASLMRSLQPRRGRSTLTLQQLRARSNAMATWDRQGRGCRTADVCSACDICSSFSRWNTFRCMSSQCSSSCHHSNQSLLSHSTSSKINPFPVPNPIPVPTPVVQTQQVPVPTPPRACDAGAASSSASTSGARRAQASASSNLPICGWMDDNLKKAVDSAVSELRIVHLLSALHFAQLWCCFCIQFAVDKSKNMCVCACMPGGVWSQG